VNDSAIHASTGAPAMRSRLSRPQPTAKRDGARRYVTLNTSARGIRPINMHDIALCGGAITPAIRSASRPPPLSPRAREIAAMVATGLSNREIASKLLVSVRTVEGHIYRACIKLDVSDRDDLAAIVSGSLQS
jgi:DNA-binding CsgD family transcriptional regulator